MRFKRKNNQNHWQNLPALGRGVEELEVMAARGVSGAAGGVEVPAAARGVGGVEV